TERLAAGQADQPGDRAERVLLLLPAGTGPQRVPRAAEAQPDRQAALRRRAHHGLGYAGPLHLRLQLRLERDRKRLTLTRGRARGLVAGALAHDGDSLRSTRQSRT